MNVVLKKGTIPSIGDSIFWDGAAWVAEGPRARSHDTLFVNTESIVHIVQGPYRSPDFVSGSAGWQFAPDGSLEANNIIARGTIYASAGEIGGFTIAATTLYAGSGSDRVGLLPGSYPFYAGHETPASAPFRVAKNGDLTATSATISGTITASAGLIGGWTISATEIKAGAEIVMDSSVPKIEIAGGGYIQATNYVSGFDGFHIGNDFAEFGDVQVRGSLHCVVFVKDLISAHAGSLLVTKSAGKLDLDYTTAGTMTVETPPGGSWLFDTGDIVRVKEEYASGVHESWVTVTQTGTLNQYTTVLSSGDNTTYHRGTTAVDYGQSGDGGVLQTADMAHAPWLSVFTHAGAPWTTLTHHLRLGNLNGVGDYSSDKYGIFIGDYAGDKWMSYDPTNSLRIRGDALISGTVTADMMFMYTGTWDVDATGFRLNADEICGQNAGTDQFILSAATGKATCGAGKVVLDASGATFNRSGDGTIALTDWLIDDVLIARLEAARHTAADYTRMFLGVISADRESRVELSAVGDDGTTILWVKSGGWAWCNGGLTLGNFTASDDPGDDLWTTADARIDGGLYVGSIVANPAAGTITATGIITAGNYIVALGGVHVGGSSDPGTDNLVVDGKASVGSTDAPAHLYIRSASVYDGIMVSCSDSDNARKYSGLVGRHYDIDEEPLGMIWYDSNVAYSEITIGGGTSVLNAPTQILFYTAADTTTTTGTLAVFIDSSQRISMGAGKSLTDRLTVHFNSANYVATFFNDGNNVNRYGINIQCGEDDASTAGVAYPIYFHDGDGTACGGVIINAGAISFWESSDARRKKDVRPTSRRGVEEIMALPVKDFRWLESETAAIKTGFIAQDVKKVMPEAVVDVDGLMGLSQMRFIPMMVKAIQELAARVEALEAS